MNVPESLNGFRTLFSSFHHFRPEQARAILANAMEKKQAIAVFEDPPQPSCARPNAPGSAHGPHLDAVYSAIPMVAAYLDII